MGYGLIGKTLGHSFSKIVHESLSDYTYELYPLPTEELFHEFMEKKDFPGINVTIPYKQMVIPYCSFIDEKAKAIGAINTIVNRDGVLHGYNTDYDGFLYLTKELGVNFRNKSVLVLGTGGTFRTVTTVAKDQKAGHIYVASRSPHQLSHLKSQGITPISYEQAENLEELEIIINTSPIGMYPDNGTLPLSLDKFQHLQCVIDVVYNPLRSALVQEAKRKRLVTSGGLPMLVAQAKFAAEHFQGKEIPKSATDKVVGEIAQKQSNLVLIGMPSCGKSTLGAKCALAMGRKFIDLDEEITKKIGTSISEYFQTQGEDAFRTVETQVCAHFAKENGLVISTGGGIVTRPENILALQQNGILVYVTRPLEDLDFGGDRPLSSSLEAVKTLEEHRTPLYLKACDLNISNTSDILSVSTQIQEAFYEIFNS